VNILSVKPLVAEPEYTIQKAIINVIELPSNAIAIDESFSKLLSVC
jgi:hypothetical protein